MVVNFKKNNLLLIIFLCFGSVLFGQSISIAKPAASINLVKPELVSVQQLNAQIEAITALRMRAGQTAGISTKAEKLEVLDMMISDILIMQGAERDGIKAEKSEVDTAVANQKSQYEQQKRRAYSDTEFRNEVLRETGYSWDKYVDQLEKQIVQQKYIVAKKQADIQKMMKMPDNNDIAKFYRENKTKFSNPDMVRYSQIFISSINMDSNKKKEAEQRAEEAYRKYQNGSATFEQLVNDYTEDQNAKYRNGDSGYIAYNDSSALGYLGKTFMDALFSTETGEVSGVIKSNIGYHIIKITDYREARLLTLDDNILPTINQSVREYIAQQLIVQAQNTALSQALKDLVEDLKKDADIRIFEGNID